MRVPERGPSSFKQIVFSPGAAVYPAGGYGAQRVTVTLLIFTGVRGLSFASVGTWVMAVTTLTGSHSPKMV